MKRLAMRAALKMVCLAGWAAFGLAHAIRRPRRPERLGKVLVIKLWAIGEVVMSLPVLQAIKRHEPGSEVHMLVGKAAASVVEHSPFCDRVITIDEQVFLAPRPWRALKLARELRKERYDTVVVLHHFLIFGLFAWLLGASVRAGMDRSGEGFALTVKVPRPQAPTHRVEEYLSVVSALGVRTDGLRPCVTFAREAEVDAAEMLSSLGLTVNGVVVGLLPTGGG